ncbi:MAG: AMP-binding protein [archaeon]
MNSKLSQRLIEALKKNKDKRLVSFKSGFFYHRYSYYDILCYSSRFMSFLKKNNIKKGDKIILCSYNCPQYTYSILGSLFYGAIIVPLDFGSTESLIARIINETNPKLVISSRYKIYDPAGLPVFYMEDMDELVKKEKMHALSGNTKDSDIFEILYTSGTTSEPKGVILSHENLYANLTSVTGIIDFSMYDNFISVLPLSHMFEQAGELFIIINGSHFVQFYPKRPVEILNIFKHEKINSTITVPAFLDILKKGIIEKASEQKKLNSLNKMLKFSQNFPFWIRRILFSKIHKGLGGSFEMAVSGGAPLSESTELFWESLGVKIIQGYGLTEASPVLSICTEPKKKIGSVGFPIKGVKIKIAQDGEILAGGKNITQGYFNKPTETNNAFEKGFLKTGDFGYFDEEGFLFIKGRKKNMILKPDGVNVYPEDIEKALANFHEVKKSCVIGLTNNDDVIIAAVVILSEKINQSQKLARELMQKANNLLEEHQQIQEVIFWDKEDFPMTHTLKIKRDIVTEEISQKANKALTTKTSDTLISILSSVSRISPENINDNTKLYADLKFDSIKVIELSFLIEEKLRKEIDESRIDRYTKVSDLRKIIASTEKEAVKLKLSKKYFSIFFVLPRLFCQKAIYLLSLIFCRAKITYMQNLNKLNGQIIVVFNHQSHLDGVFILNNLPLKYRTKIAAAAAADHFFVKKHLFDMRTFLSRAMQLLAPAYPMSRDLDKIKRTSIKQSLEFTGEVIDMGYSLILSPEGTRTLTGKMNPFKRGIGLIVKESGLPVLPVKLDGLYEILPKGAFFPKKIGDVSVKFGKIVTFKNTDSEIFITNELEKIIRSM